jgi:hypothetical protein
MTKVLKMLGNGRKRRKLAELVKREKWIKVRQNWQKPVKGVSLIGQNGKIGQNSKMC